MITTEEVYNECPQAMSDMILYHAVYLLMTWKRRRRELKNKMYALNMELEGLKCLNIIAQRLGEASPNLSHDYKAPVRL